MLTEEICFTQMELSLSRTKHIVTLPHNGKDKMNRNAGKVKQPESVVYFASIRVFLSQCILYFNPICTGGGQICPLSQLF